MCHKVYESKKLDSSACSSRTLHGLIVYTSPSEAERCQGDDASGGDDPEQVLGMGYYITFLLIVEHLEI